MEAQVLSEENWAALEAAEAPLYPPHSGSFALTDVFNREEAEIAFALWMHAQASADAAIESDLDYDTPEFEAALQAETARRVADALAVLAFGREFIDVPALPLPAPANAVADGRGGWVVGNHGPVPA